MSYTTADIKKLDGVNGHRVFCSNIAGRKVRVSIVKNPDARNYKDGDLMFQATYNSWNNIPAADYKEICSQIGHDIAEAELEG